MHSFRFRSAVLLGAVSASLGVLSGCGDSGSVVNPGSQSLTSAPLATGGAASVYAAVDNSIPVVVQYGATTSGTAIPTNSINITQTSDVEAIAVDKTSGTVYVTGFSYSDNQPEVWAYSSAAATTPSRTIMMGLTATTEPYDMTVDSNGNVYVATYDTNSGLGSVLEYSSTATGAATPLKNISGSSTGILTPLTVAVDTAGTIYVSSLSGSSILTGTISEFSSGQNGNATPVRSITSSNSFYYGLAVDANMNLYATQGTGTANGFNLGSRIVKFAPGASGAATPTNTISSSSFGVLYGLQVDSAGNLFTLNQSTQNALTILGFGPTATGYTSPAVVLTPAALNGYTTSSLAVR